MANDVLMAPGAYDAESEQLRRRLAYAQALQGQSQTPLQGQMVSNHYVAPSWTQHAARLLGSYLGRKEQDSAMRDYQTLSDNRRAEGAADMQKIAALLRGKPAETFQPLVPNDDEGNPLQPATSEATGPDLAGALQVAMASRNPMAQQIGGDLLKRQLMPKNVVVGRSLLNQDTGAMVGQDSTWQADQDAARQARTEQAEAARQSRMQELEARLADQRTRDADRATLQRELAQMREDSRREMAQLAAGLRQPPAPHPITVMDETTGRMVVRDARSGQTYGVAPNDNKIQGQFNQDTAALNGSINSFDRLATVANQLLNHPGLKGTTGLRGMIPNIPGSDAADAQAQMETLKSQVGFGVLQDMRNNSKTGGALGNVSDAEGKRLETNLAALSKAQSYEQMQDSLREIIKYADDAKDRVRGAYNMKYADNPRTQNQPAAIGGPAAPKVGEIKNGFRYKGGNPADKNNWEKQ